jgi:hypothetical protein
MDYEVAATHTTVCFSLDQDSYYRRPKREDLEHSEKIAETELR